MPHLFFLIAIIVGLFYGIYKIFIYGLKTFVLIDERFVSNVKEKNNSLLNFLLTNDEDETLEEQDKKKIKRINTALRFDFFISTFSKYFF